MVVSDAEQQPSAYRIKRLCPAKMVPSVSATEAERTGEAERKRAFHRAGRGLLSQKACSSFSSVPPLLHSPLPTPPCLELREGEIEGRIQSSTSNALHAPRPLTLPLLSRRWRKHPTASRGWQREPWEKKTGDAGKSKKG